MASLKPLFDNLRRTDFGYPETYVGANKHEVHDYTYQTPPLSHRPYGGGANYQTHINPVQPHHSKPASSPVIVDDGAAATIEWQETPEAHIFKTRLPNGVRREDVRVQIEDDEVLKIIAEKAAEAEDRYHSNMRMVEVSRGRFVTSLKLPEDAMAHLIRSYWENGVLTVKIPRKEMISYGHHVRNVDIINDHRY